MTARRIGYEIRKMAAVLCAAAMCFGAADRTAVDTSASVIYAKAVSWSEEQGIVTNRSVLNGKCTKGMLAVTLWVAKKMPAPTVYPAYTDASGYILQAEQWVTGVGLMQPEAGTLFGTEAAVSRRTVARTVWMSAGCPAVQTAAAYGDVSADDPDYQAVMWVTARHFMEGFTAGMFGPDATCTGLQMTAAVYNASYGTASRQQYATAREYWENGAFSATYDGTATNASQITREQLVAATARVVLEAKERGYHYGSSGSLPPTDDGKISCDRLIAKALWYLGFTDQNRGGITCGNMRTYLINHGFLCSKNWADIGYGSIMLVQNRNGNGPHAFLVLDFVPETKQQTRLDEGRESRVNWSYGMQPVIHEGWGFTDDFYVFNVPSP